MSNYESQAPMDPGILSVRFIHGERSGKEKDSFVLGVAVCDTANQIRKSELSVTPPTKFEKANFQSNKDTKVE